jgi:MoaA/NifB/PqqE/SkfB family radical SAM enzyme
MIISFHSLDQERYERMTGSKAPLEKVTRTIEYMRGNSDIHIALKYVITSYNSGETQEILEFAESKGVSAEIHPVMVSPTNRETSTNDNSLLPEKSELLKAIEEVTQFKQKGGSMNESLDFYRFCRKAIEKGEYRWDCKAGERFFTVSPDCRFGICQDFPMSKKMTDEDFIQTWKSEAFRGRMETMRRKCSGCLWSCYLSLESLQNLFRNPPIDDLSILHTF